MESYFKESRVGIGFIDIADYTFLSKFLSPQENQTLLNGLYSAFLIVLQKHGGSLNKIEGDSLMFQFDDFSDPELANLEEEDRHNHIVKNLFYTCVEMQRVCVLFNNAEKAFLANHADPGMALALQRAFAIIEGLRGRNEVSNAMHAFFQVRVRIGANYGEVMLGNFGPEGYKHWDVIGMPVIEAKRMEATAPVGGLRISESFYHTLESIGTVNDYFERFRREARLTGSVYANIQKDELFARRKVVISEKKGATYWTYSVQVNYKLPEHIVGQARSLLAHGPSGADGVIELLKYYRGNTYVIDALEALFRSEGIRVRKHDLLSLMAPKKAAELTGDIDSQFSLAKILHLMNRFQDGIKKYRETARTGHFLGYEITMGEQEKRIREEFEDHRRSMVNRAGFFEVTIPLVYQSILASILEYQTADEGLVELEML
ncbi:MAG: adenylate/guanylate cyclase domain-containing protein [Spirochaetales bacterium]